MRQGDTLSSTMLLIYTGINDLVNNLNSLNIGIDVGTRKLCSFFYADDAVLFAECPSERQRLLDVLDDWCNTWKLPVNYEKSNVIHFRKHRQMRSQMKSIMGNKRLGYAESYKYLGAYI